MKPGDSQHTEVIRVEPAGDRSSESRASWKSSSFLPVRQCVERPGAGGGAGLSSAKPPSATWTATAARSVFLVKPALPSAAACGHHVETRHPRKNTQILSLGYTRRVSSVHGHTWPAGRTRDPCTTAGSPAGQRRSARGRREKLEFLLGAPVRRACSRMQGPESGESRARVQRVRDSRAGLSKCRKGAARVAQGLRDPTPDLSAALRLLVAAVRPRRGLRAAWKAARRSAGSDQRRSGRGRGPAFARASRVREELSAVLRARRRHRLRSASPPTPAADGRTRARGRCGRPGGSSRGAARGPARAKARSLPRACARPTPQRPRSASPGPQRPRAGPAGAPRARTLRGTPRSAPPERPAPERASSLRPRPSAPRAPRGAGRARAASPHAAAATGRRLPRTGRLLTRPRAGLHAAAPPPAPEPSPRRSRAASPPSQRGPEALPQPPARRPRPHSPLREAASLPGPGPGPGP